MSKLSDRFLEPGVDLRRIEVVERHIKGIPAVRQHDYNSVHRQSSAKKLAILLVANAAGVGIGTYVKAITEDHGDKDLVPICEYIPRVGDRIVHFSDDGEIVDQLVDATGTEGHIVEGVRVKIFDQALCTVLEDAGALVVPVTPQG